MAHQSLEFWTKFFKDTQIPEDIAATYAQTFTDNRMDSIDALNMTKEDLSVLGINVMGDVKKIIRCLKQLAPIEPVDIKPGISAKIPAAKLPQLQAEMTKPQFRKFLIDWSVFKKITNIPDNQVHAQLYNSCDDSVQNSLLNTVSDFFRLSEEQLLKTLEEIVTKRSNPAVHRLQFSSL